MTTSPPSHGPDEEGSDQVPVTLRVVHETNLLCTERLEIHRHTIQRPECTGGNNYDVWHAWLKMNPAGEDVSKPICIITMGFAGFVEWIHVDPDFRRRGLATEAMSALADVYDEICIDGATDEGDAFVDAFLASA